MITGKDVMVALQRQQDMRNRSLEAYEVSQKLPKGEKKEGIITRGLHSLGERLVITGVRLQLLNRQLNSTPRGG